MPRYYFHVCNGTGFTEDEEGRELPDTSAARINAVKEAREIMSHELRNGDLDLTSFIEVEDEKRELLFTVIFKDAINLKHDYGGSVEV